MTRLADLIKAAQEDPSGDLAPVVIPKLYEFLERPESEQVPSERALDYQRDVALGKFKHNRSGRFSPSGLYQCKRKQLFGYAGMEELPPSVELAMMARMGTHSHVDWQIMGLTGGFMKEVEWWAFEPSLDTGGSIDAILFDDSIFELKTINNFKYAAETVGQIRESWRLQIAIYFLLAENTGVKHRNKASLVIHDRSTGQFHERRIQRSVEDEDRVVGDIREMQEFVANNELPPMLPGCVTANSYTYRGCPFRDRCKDMTQVRRT